MEYAVVRFTEDESVSETPVCWLQITDGNIQTWWPDSSTDLNTSIEKKVKPNEETWELSDIVIEKYCADLSTARVATSIIADLAPTKVKMEYAVVRFTEDDSVSEVPICWLHIRAENSECWWPPQTTKNVSSLITKKTEPDKNSWGLCDVKVEKYCANLKKARNAANDIEYLTTDDEKLGKGRRKQIATRFTDSSDTENENNLPLRRKRMVHPKVKVETKSSGKTESLFSKTSKDADKPNPKKSQPSLKSEVSNLAIDLKSLPTVINNSDIFEAASQGTQFLEKGLSGDPLNDDIQLNNFDANFNVIMELLVNEGTESNDLLKDSVTIKKSFNSEGKHSTEKKSTATSGEKRPFEEAGTAIVTEQQSCSCLCAEQGKIIIRMIASLQVDVKGLYEKIKKQEPRRNENEVNADTRMIKQLLPLNDLASIDNIEKLLTSSEEAKSQFKAFIQRISGKSAKEMIERVFIRVFSTQVASVVTWKGVGQNFGIYDLSIVEIIKDSVCNNFSDYTEADFEQTAKEWIRLGKQRKERERKTLAKGTKKKSYGLTDRPNI